MSPAECPTFASDLASGLQDTLASKLGTRACSRLSTVRFATGPKRSMGHFLGAEKIIFLIRGAEADEATGGRAGGILSIPAEEVSLGSPRVGTIHVHAPTPHTPPLQAFLADFSQQTTRFSHLFAKGVPAPGLPLQVKHWTRGVPAPG